LVGKYQSTSTCGLNRDLLVHLKRATQHPKEGKNPFIKINLKEVRLEGRRDSFGSNDKMDETKEERKE